MSFQYGTHHQLRPEASSYLSCPQAHLSLRTFPAPRPCSHVVLDRHCLFCLLLFSRNLGALLSEPQLPDAAFILRLITATVSAIDLALIATATTPMISCLQSTS